MLMGLMAKSEYLIVPKGTEFTGSGKLELKTYSLYHFIYMNSYFISYPGIMAEAKPQPKSPQTQRAFDILKPICVCLVKEPTLPNVQMLQRLLDGIPPDPIQQLHQYILFPLRLILREPEKR